MTLFLIITGFLLALLAVLGSIFPLIPGPPLSVAALLILSYAKNWEPFSTEFLIITGSMALIIIVMDYVLPLEGARRYGASRYGVAGALLGIVAGFLLMPPVGIFIGALLGAVAGELATKKSGHEALRAGWGVFVGFMVGTGIRLAFTLAILFFYVTALL